MSRTNVIRRCVGAWTRSAREPRRRVGAGAALALAGLLAMSVGARATVPDAQDPAAPPAQAATKRPASSGVYTAAQATRGEQTFSNICQGCHSLSSFTNDKFRASWTNASLAELFGLISETMPDDDPGGMKPAEYADVLAYLLKANRLNAGERELPASADGLKDIVIDFATGTHSGE
jgi:mono/diheme cytochrome c family protein